MMKLFTAISSALLFLCVSVTAQAQKYQTPEITAIGSPADGEVSMTVTVDRGKAFLLSFPVINVYRADGTKLTIDNDFSLLTTDENAFWESGWSPNYLYERSSLPVDVTITGLSSGEASFYVTVEDRDVPNATSDASNIEAVTISGTEKDPSDVNIILSVSVVSSVADEAKNTNVPAYPNPASNAIRFDVPVESGNLLVKVLDIRGTTVMNQEVAVSAGVCNLNISTLLPGMYFATITNTQERVRTGFVVVR